jgi:hypothetical protein
MKDLGYLESKSFLNSLDKADSSLDEKLNRVLSKNIVPELHLLWMLFRIQYAFEYPDSIYIRIINDLSSNDMGSYNYYLKKGFDYSKAKDSQTTLWKQMGYGIVMSPLQCDGYYMLGSPPDYIDPVYKCLGDLSAPVIQLVKQKKVPPPQPPPLIQLSNINTEVFIHVGLYDHITPYQVGIELSKYFKNNNLFIAEDNHMMMKYKDCYPDLRNAFFIYGIGSAELNEVRRSIECKEWKPQ